MYVQLRHIVTYDYVIFCKRSAPLLLHLPCGNDFLERQLNGRKVVEAEETTRNTT